MTAAQQQEYDAYMASGGHLSADEWMQMRYGTDVGMWQPGAGNDPAAVDGPIYTEGDPGGVGPLDASGGTSTTVVGTTTPTTSGTTSGGWGYLTEPFTGIAPQWKPGPQYTAPKFEAPPPFSYKSFEAPTADSIYADPSYQFREGQGRQALEQSAAGRGVLRTGGTLKDLINYGQNAASQEYSSIFDRAVTGHNMGLQQELGTYATNYGVGRDVYDRLFEGSKAEFAPQQREHEAMNEREFNSFLADYDIFERNRRRAGDYLMAGANIGAGAV
jgi:hypothetical protein